MWLIWNGVVGVNVDHLTSVGQHGKARREGRSPVGDVLEDIDRKDQIEGSVDVWMKLLDADIEVLRWLGVVRKRSARFANELETSAHWLELCHLDVD